MPIGITGQTGVHGGCHGLDGDALVAPQKLKIWKSRDAPQKRGERSERAAEGHDDGT